MGDLGGRSDLRGWRFKQVLGGYIGGDSLGRMGTSEVGLTSEVSLSKLIQHCLNGIGVSNAPVIDDVIAGTRLNKRLNLFRLEGG